VYLKKPDPMDVYCAYESVGLTPEQLKLAASIKERIDGLNKQLRGILGAPATLRAAPPRNRGKS